MPASKTPTNRTAIKAPPMYGEHHLRSENLAFDIDVWYPPLAEHTFSTVFLPLKRREAEAIVAYYNATWRSLPHELTSQAVETLLALEARIDKALIEHFASRGAFLRLCGRSPKDGEPTDPVLRSKIWASYQSTLQTMSQAEQIPVTDDNLRVAAIAKTESWMKVHSGAHAMSLLLTSERVFSDMIDWLHYGEPEQLVLREFSDAFDLSTEFRCYIQSGILQGISQYDTYAMHSYLQDPSNRAIVIRAVVSEWRKVKDCIETIDGSYCADFGVDMVQRTAQFIELSPYRKCTGPALFAWKGPAELVVPERPDIQDDTVRDLVQMGGAIAEHAVFRVRSKPIPGIGGLVEMNWDFRWSQRRMDTPKPYRNVCSHVMANTTIAEKTINILKHIQERLSEKQHVLFVYGTLKRKCHWHSKYMTGAHFLGEASTVRPQTLVIGQCGVPYLLDLRQDDDAKPVRGELWRLSEEMLQGIDEYEGIEKGHYVRKEIEVECTRRRGTTAICKAFCYFYAIKSGASDVEASLLQATRLAEYPAGEQKSNYKPIHHIQVKQLQYLGEHATT
ncbi:AIG2-like family [Seminavis robusta]|uniref:AIG2-like family n=1 Tax=Seminavis robusta TaxID=568900 RepID=A0A9N8DTH3_9STRA|nr:AIG2-like family [Seminavis robusta]|eukprot:Sro238_g095690.1 AIG2-like family (561) ;mRNA; f:81137-82819